MRHLLLALISLSFVADSCAPTRFVKPLKVGEHSIGANLGGPVINLFEGSFPMPLSGITYGHGITNDLTAFGSLHPTSLIFGVVQMEAGGVYQIIAPDSTKRYIPGVTVSPVANLAFDTWEGNFKVWPQADINAYFNYGRKKNFFYVGVSNWFELAKYRAHKERQEVNWIFNPQLGHIFASKKWNAGIEVKYLAPNYSNENVVVGYTRVFGNNGALGAYFSVWKTF